MTAILLCIGGGYWMFVFKPTKAPQHDCNSVAESDSAVISDIIYYFMPKLKQAHRQRDAVAELLSSDRFNIVYYDYQYPDGDYSKYPEYELQPLIKACYL